MTQERQAPVLTEAQFRRVVAVAKASQHAKRNLTLLYFSFALGLRAKEMSSLLVRDVLSPRGEMKDEVLLTKSSTKGGKQRLVYLANKDVRRCLNDYLKERQVEATHGLRQDAALFLSQKGGRFSPNTMQMLFKRLFVLAGIENASSHSGRRAFATSLIERGVDSRRYPA